MLDRPADPPSPGGRAVWRAVWTSRLAVIFAGVAGVVQIGLAPGAAAAYDPQGITSPFGYLANAVIAPLARWDSVWYLTIARYGYAGVRQRMAFFPLYPELIHLTGPLAGSDLVAGILISLTAMAVALYLLHRLVALDFGTEVAATTVLLVAFFPVSFFLSAVYTEALFLALSVGCIYAARRERWLVCGVLGGLAAATRNGGVALVVPAAVIYLYGARGTGAPGAGRHSGAAGWRRLRPRHRLGPSVLWLLLIPAGLGAYLAYLGLRYGDALAPLQVQAIWFRHLRLPLVTVWEGARQAWEGLRQLIQGPVPPYHVPPYAQTTISAALQDIYLFLFLAGGLVGLVFVLLELGAAYGLYTLTMFILALADPVRLQPLASLPRFELVIFPLFIWAARLLTRTRLTPYLIGSSAVLLGLLTVEFATWHWVA
ncbi:MAG: mannosyltransferase family protein [Actinomycetota bacterium]|nr:mannosyltransferase family protein [Actinomycetota bacterium]